jgi:hypothetical protein
VLGRVWGKIECGNRGVERSFTWGYVTTGYKLGPNLSAVLPKGWME